MLNLKRNTKIVIGIFTAFYLTAWGISLMGIGGTYGNLFCSILTCIVAIAAFYVMFKSVILAKKIERAPVWSTNCCCRGSAIQVVLCVAIYMFLLGVLKFWSVADLFADHWFYLPETYRTQSWAFLAENATSILLSWVVLELFEAKYHCAQIIKSFHKHPGTIKLYK